MKKRDEILRRIGSRSTLPATLPPGTGSETRRRIAEAAALRPEPNPWRRRSDAKPN